MMVFIICNQSPAYSDPESYLVEFLLCCVFFAYFFTGKFPKPPGSPHLSIFISGERVCVRVCVCVCVCVGGGGGTLVSRREYKTRVT